MSMKTALTKSILLLLLVGVFAVPAQRVFAVDPPSTPPAQPAPTGPAQDLAAGTSASHAPATTGDSAKAAGSSSCGFDPICWLAYVPAAVMYLFLEVASVLLWVSGYLLNLALYKGVVDFGGSIGGTAGIGVGWGVLRDLGNIVLIFGFVFIGFQTLLGLDNFGVKKTLPKLLLFALLLNFSLFISQAIIDTSNLFATAIYSNVTTQGSEGCKITDLTCASNYGLASAMANDLGIGTTFNVAALKSFGDGNGYMSLVVLLMATVFVLIASVVFFAAAIMLIIRIVVLCFLMVASPIGFAGMALPPLHKYASQWWGMLLSQSIFVPVYLLLVLVGLKVAEGLSGSDHDLLGAITSGNGGAPQAFITFAIIISFMVGALIIAKNMGAMGADFAISNAGRVAFGTTAFVARRTGGRTANYVSEALRNNRQNSRVGRFLGRVGERDSWYARGLAEQSAKVAKSNLDVRGSKLVGGALKAGHLDLGTGRKGGYRTLIDEEKKKREDYADSRKISKEDSDKLKPLEDDIKKLNKDLVEELRKPKTDARDAEIKRLEADIKEKTTLLGADRDAVERENKEKYLKNLGANNWAQWQGTTGNTIRQEAVKAIRGKMNDTGDKKLIAALKAMSGGGDKKEEEKK